MAGANNPRKFKDRIALLEQKQAESTAMYNEVMKDVSEVKTGGHNAVGVIIPRHHAPSLSLPNHHPHFRYGGSLPNVNQMTAGSGLTMPPSSSPGSGPASGPPGLQDQFQFAMSGMPQMPQSVPLDPTLQFVSGSGEAGDTTSSQLRGAERSRGGGAVSPGGGPLRTRSGERWRCDPYADRQSYYSSSLVSTYLSPPPESRWRRTSSDSALYQKLNNPQSSNNQKSASEQNSPEYCGAGLEDVKPSADLLQSLLREPADQLGCVKEEPPRLVTMPGGGGLVSQTPGGRLPSPGPQYRPVHSGSSSPVSPAPPPLYSPGQLPHHQHQPFLPPQQNNLEEKFQKFRLDCQPQFQDSGGNYLTQNPGTPTTGPTSPHTPSTLPDIYIQDWSQDCDKSLDAADFAEFRDDLEPIDDQLLATLTNSATFVDPAVEEQFKINY